MKKTLLLMLTLLCSVMTWADSYTKVTSAPTDWSGDYLIVAEASSNLYGFTNSVSSKWGICEVIQSSDIDGNTITPSSTSKVVAITIEKEDNAYKIKGTGSNYLKATTGNMSYATTGYQLWTIGLQQDGTVLISATSGSDVLKVQYNHNNGSGGFRVYKNGTQTNPYLYKKVGGNDPTPDEGGDSGDDDSGDDVIATASFNGKDAKYTEGWTTTGTGITRTDCVVIGDGENITSPSFDLTKYSQVTITFSGRRYGTLTGSKATVDAAIAGQSVGTLDITNGSVEAVNGCIEFTPTSDMTNVQIVFTCTNATSAGSTHGAGIGSITITGILKSAPEAKTIDFYAAGTDGYYTTFSNDKAVTIPEMVEVGDEYAQFTVSTVWADGNDLVYENLEAAVDGLYYLSENEGYLIKAEYSGDVTYTGSKAFSVEYTELDYNLNGQDEYNVLRPASEAKTGDNKYYMLAYSDDTFTPASLGFYWGAANGAAFTSRANSAYLALPQGTSAKGFSFADAETTGIKDVNATSSRNAAYNLAGQRVNANAKGIVIMNGKKYLNK